jgi:putative peptidoglycan lipid II flippase
VRLPDTLFNLIAGGALTYALIPVFSSYEKENRQAEAWRLISLVFNVMLVILTIFILVAEFLAPTFVARLLVPGYSPSDQALVTTLTRILLVQPLILGVGTIATTVLSTKRQFLLPALSIAIYNFGLIGGLLFSVAIPGVGIYGPTYGVLVTAVLQILLQIWGVMKIGFRYSFTLDIRNKGLHDVMRLLIPNMIGVAISSTGPILDTAYASYLPDKASLAALHNAQLLYVVPLTLLAQTLSQAALPRLSTLAATARYVRLSRLIIVVISFLLCIPCALALYFLGKPAIHLFFQHGAFTEHSSVITSLALLGYALGLPGETISQLLVPGFYALKDAWTPLFTGILGLVIRVIFILLLLQFMTGIYVILAIPLATSISVTVDGGIRYLLLLFRFRTKVKQDKGMTRLLQWRRSAYARSEQMHLIELSH